MNYEKYGNVAFSPVYTYNNSNHGTDEGSSLSNAYAVLENKGALTLDDLPYDDGYYDGRTISAEEYNKLSEGEKKLYNYDSISEKYYTDAHTYRARNFGLDKMLKALKIRVKKVNSFTIRELGEDGAINEIKKKLYEGKVVATEGAFYFDKDHLRYRYKADVDGKKEYAYIQNVGPDELGDGHAFVIVGYNDNVKVTLEDGTELKGAFKIANSWGTGYCNGGYAWIMYDAFYKNSPAGIRNKNRLRAFNDERFYTIDVAETTPKLVADFDVVTNNYYDYHVYVKNGKNQAGHKSNVIDGGSRKSVYSGPVLVDISGVGGDDYYNDKTYTLNYGNTYYASRFVVRSVALRDDLGNIVVDKKFDYDIDEFFSALDTDDAELISKYRNGFFDSIKLDLEQGDVNYDGAFDSDDAVLINEFLNGKAYSALQKDLADLNGDGEFDKEDAAIAFDEFESLYWSEDGKYIGTQTVNNLSWNEINGDWYFLDWEGKKVTDKIIYDATWNGNFYVDNKGRCVMNKVFTYGDTTYRADENGYLTEV